MLRSSLAETVNVVFGLVEPDHSLREQLMSSELVSCARGPWDKL
jgi:hypothetical protein